MERLPTNLDTTTPRMMMLLYTNPVECNCPLKVSFSRYGRNIISSFAREEDWGIAEADWLIRSADETITPSGSLCQRAEARMMVKLPRLRILRGRHRDIHGHFNHRLRYEQRSTTGLQIEAISTALPIQGLHISVVKGKGGP